MSGVRSTKTCFLKVLLTTAIVAAGEQIAAPQETSPPSNRKEPTPSRPLVARRVSAAPTADAPTASAKQLNLRYVHSRPFLAAFVHPQQLLASPDAQFVPVEVFRALLLEQYGIDLNQLDEVTFLLGFDGTLEFKPAVVCHFTEPYDREAILTHLIPPAENPGDGKPLLFGVRSSDTDYVAFADETTVLLGPQSELNEMLCAGDDDDGPMIERLRRVDGSQTAGAVCTMEPLRGVLMLAALTTPPQTASVRKLFKIPQIVSDVELQFRLEENAELSIVLHVEDNADLQPLHELLDLGVVVSCEAIDDEIAELQADQANPAEVEQLRYLHRWLELFAKSLDRRLEDHRLVLRIDGQTLAAALTGILMNEAISTTDDPDELASRARSSKNLTQIGLGMTSYATVHGKLPRSSYNRDGKPLLSWRVHLLPFVGQQPLYEQFHLDESWDSEHNRRLIAQRPAIFQSHDGSGEGKTSYLAATGPAALFAPGDDVTADEISDEMAGVIMVVEANAIREIEWTKPDDFVFDPVDLLAGLGGLRPGGFLALLTDGTVEFVLFSNTPDDLRDMFRPVVPQE